MCFCSSQFQPDKNKHFARNPVHKRPQQVVSCRSFPCWELKGRKPAASRTSLRPYVVIGRIIGSIVFLDLRHGVCVNLLFAVTRQGDLLWSFCFLFQFFARKHGDNYCDVLELDKRSIDKKTACKAKLDQTKKSA